MDIQTAMRTRKSIRKYKPDLVSKELLREVLEIATRAPSAMNTQPWEFTVITGEVLENIKRANVEKLNAGAPMQPEHLVVGWPQDSIYRQRQVELGKEIFKLMNIPREDKAKREKWMERGFRYFDAPAAIIITADRSLTEDGPLLDIGAVIQTICLAALVFGLGTCIEDQGVLYPEVVREYTGMPDSKRLIISIAIGYPDWDFPANNLESTREQIDKITTWCGF
ncbi:MAG: nitroreductase [Thermodesulfobacteriota bacterium]|nr:nitroreductase [Thermodesulfobacteriota bacterium]